VSGLNLNSTSVTKAISSVTFVLVMLMVLVRAAHAEDPTSPKGTGTFLTDSILMQSDYGQYWYEEGVKISVLRGNCRVGQGETELSAERIVIWNRTDETSRGTRQSLSIFLEGDVRIDTTGQTIPKSVFMAELKTVAKVEERISRNSKNESQEDPLFQRAMEFRKKQEKSRIQQTQFLVSQETEDGPAFEGFVVQRPGGKLRKFRLYSRSGGDIHINAEQTNTIPPEQVIVADGGVNLIIEGINEDVSGFGPVRVVDLSADRIVIWTQPVDMNDGQEHVQSGDTPFAVYLEGHVQILQGNREIQANYAVYDDQEKRGLMINAELKTLVPKLNGKLRVRAKQIRMLSENNYHAVQAWATASEFGKPGYRVRATDIIIDERYPKSIFGTPIDPETGLPDNQPETWVTSLNNTFLIEDFPVFYLPKVSMPAENPNIPLRRIKVGQNRIYGTQIKTRWDLFQLLGREEPKGTKTDLLLDYQSKRGPGFGLESDYKGEDLWGLSGSHDGNFLGYYIHDTGKDNLGLNRRSLETETENRYRFHWQHRQRTRDDLTIMAEIGALSDRNFLEQYYEKEFDEGKDNETLIYLRKKRENWAGTILGRAQLNDFSNTTEWYPKADLYGLHEPFFNGFLNWSSHSSAGYANLKPADAPTDPAEVFAPLPYMTNASGAVLMSRHELSVPFEVGPINFVPYAMGEAAYWSEDFTNQDINRFVGSAGIRSSLLFWRPYYGVHNRILGLNGLAHKVLFEAEYSYTDASESFNNIPQYNEFDENSQERFRERLLTNTFGGILPAIFEPRYYAIRSGAGSSVTSPYHELVEDQQVARFAIRQRLQTKVGPPEHQRIKDWMTLDLEASYFPDATRDNFGEDIGLLGANYSWFIGSRTRFLANAEYDLFNNAQQIWNLGFVTQRSSRGSLYVGLRQIKGANLHSQTLSASFSYQMSPKWISTVGTAYDLKEQMDRGQSLTLTRLGKDFNFHLGITNDVSKDNVGVALMIQPKFIPLGLSSSQLGSVAGNQQQR
jgi:lipopolysaccharide assembly outer membrane protein LptD (OstA)